MFIYLIRIIFARIEQGKTVDSCKRNSDFEMLKKGNNSKLLKNLLKNKNRKNKKVFRIQFYI